MRCRTKCCALASDPPGGTIVLHLRAWTDDDFAGAAIAVGAFAHDDEAARFAAAARAAGVPVNVIDKPAFCDFSFGSIVNRSPLVIGISTDGAAPVFAQAIRAKLEAMIPFGFARWAEAARRWREAIKSSGLPFAARRQFWQMFTATALRRARSRTAAKRLRSPDRRNAGRRCGRKAGHGLGHAGRRRTRRPGAAHAARGARAAIGRRHPDRRPGRARDPRFRAPRGQEDDGRQDRLRAVVPAGRDQFADGVAGEGRQARGAAQGRRSDDLRPRRRGDRGLPQGAASRSRWCRGSAPRRARPAGSASR